MLGVAILCLSLGLPSIALGVALRRGAGKKKRAKGEARGASPGSFLVGGAVFTLVGLACLAAHLTR